MAEGGRSAFVTGAGAGIGRATALRLARAGASVAVVDLSDGAARATAQSILDGGGTALAIAADISEEAQVEDAIGRTVATFGGLDWAVNNAGVSGGAPGADDWDEVMWRGTIAVNLLGTMYCMKHQVARMVAAGGGAIVNIASVAGLVGIGGLSYTATKHGIVGMTKAAGARYGRQGVRINAVCPGMVRTAMVDRLGARDPDALAAIVAEQPSGRMSEPEEIAETVWWLCSDGASYVAGQAIAVDGGYTSV